jgi:uncharacterized membrane protein (DUF485 family)
MSGCQAGARWVPPSGASHGQTWFISPVAESDDQRRSEHQRSALPSVQAIGWAFVLLILAGYFAWMIVEMGGHAVTRAWPMLGVFVAAIAGAIAATLGLMIGRGGGRDD